MVFGRRIAGRLTGMACAVAAVAAAFAVTPAERAELLRAVREPRIDLAAAVEVESLELEAGPGMVRLLDGVLVPAEPLGDRPREFVFLGHARLVVVPPDPVEAGQIELFTSGPVFNDPVRAAVLVVADPTDVDTLLARSPATLDADQARRAEDLLAEWSLRPERRQQGAEAALVRTAAGDPDARTYFAMWVRSVERGDYYFAIDPDAFEQVTVGQFVPFSSDADYRRRLGRHLKSEQRKGRWIGYRVEDLGNWDTWMSTPILGDDDVPLWGDQGVEPYRYEIDATIDPKAGTVRARTRIHVEHERDGQRFIVLELHPDMFMDAVFDRAGNELFQFESGDRVLVELAEPATAGVKTWYDFEFHGNILVRAGYREFALRDTMRWYPHCGTVDRARYDVTFRWPRKYDLVATGRIVDSGTESGQRWQRRVVEQPAIAVSFEVGDFIFERARVGQIDVVLAFNRQKAKQMDPGLRSETMRTIRESLEFFETVFGPIPALELTAVTTPRAFSQSFLGYMTLADSAFRSVNHDDWMARKPLRDQIISHEIAHQWWGNLIGWRSYRDQWLSEAMANYASVLFLDRRGAGVHRDYLVRMSAGWRGSLGRRLKDGRSVESVGPLVLGERLNSSKAGDAYQSIVYRKGAVVLAMLARSFDEVEFLGMLRELVDHASGEVIGTDSFVRAFERMSGRDLTAFSDRYIFGTGIPEVHYRFMYEPGAADEWTIRGEARQVSSHRHVHVVSRIGEGAWDVRRERIEELDVSGSKLMIPIRVDLGSERETFETVMALEGADGVFEFSVPGRPEVVRLDPRGEVLANFHSEERSPKRVLHYRAKVLAEQQDYVEAERVFLMALEADPLRDEASDRGWNARELRRQGKMRDARIRLDLARLYIDTGRDAEAAGMVRWVDDNVPGAVRDYFRLDLVLLKSRLAIRSGRHDVAYSKLKRLKPLMEPRVTFRSWRAYSIYLQFQANRTAVSEAIAMYAVAAHMTGHEKEYAWAAREAVDRGCDLRELASLSAATSLR